MASGRVTRRSLLAGLGGITLGSNVAAQTPVATPAGRTRIPRLRVGMSAPPATMGSGMDAMWLSSLIYDAPMRWNAEGVVLPGVFTPTAASRSSRLQLQPRSDAFFSDGSRVTGRHLVDALEAIRHSDHAWRLQHVGEVMVDDAGLAVIEMERANASLLAQLAHPLVRLSAGELGSGPFVADPTRIGPATFQRNPLFWQIGRPHIDEIEIIVFPDDIQRSTAIATGEIDLLPNVPMLDVPMLANEPTLYLVGGPSNRLCHLQLRLSIPALAQARVRQILSAAIDRQRLVAVATASQAEPADTLFGGDTWTDGIDDLEMMSAEDVRAELRSLGIPADLRLHLLTDNADATLANTAVVLQEQLANCGISLSITLLEGDELTEATTTGDYDLLVSYAEPWRDPHELVWPLLSAGGTHNWSGYDSVEVDTLLAAAIALSDPEFRRARYTRLETIIRKHVPCIPLFRPYVWDAVSAAYPGYAHLPPATARGLMTLLPTDAT